MTTESSTNNHRRTYLLDPSVPLVRGNLPSSSPRLARVLYTVVTERGTATSSEQVTDQYIVEMEEGYSSEKGFSVKIVDVLLVKGYLLPSMLDTDPPQKIDVEMLSYDAIEDFASKHGGAVIERYLRIFYGKDNLTYAMIDCK